MMGRGVCERGDSLFGIVPFPQAFIARPWSLVILSQWQYVSRYRGGPDPGLTISLF